MKKHQTILAEKSAQAFIAAVDAEKVPGVKITAEVKSKKLDGL